MRLIRRCNEAAGRPVWREVGLDEFRRRMDGQEADQFARAEVWELLGLLEGIRFYDEGVAKGMDEVLDRHPDVSPELMEWSLLKPGGLPSKGRRAPVRLTSDEDGEVALGLDDLRPHRRENGAWRSGRQQPTIMANVLSLDVNFNLWAQMTRSSDDWVFVKVDVSWHLITCQAQVPRLVTGQPEEQGRLSGIVNHHVPSYLRRNQRFGFYICDGTDGMLALLGHILAIPAGA